MIQDSHQIAPAVLWILKECNVIIGDVTEDDIDLFFGPITNDDVFIKFPEDTTFPDVMHAFHFFKSKTQARKNGWDKDIPEGFWTKRVGKLKRTITILKITSSFLSCDADT